MAQVAVVNQPGLVNEKWRFPLYPHGCVCVPISEIQDSNQMEFKGTGCIGTTTILLKLFFIRT